MKPVVFLAGTALALAQTQIKPIVSQRTVNEQVNVVRLAPRYRRQLDCQRRLARWSLAIPSNSWPSIPTRSRRWCW